MHYKFIYFSGALISILTFGATTTVLSQQSKGYIAPQDTITKKIPVNSSLNKFQSETTVQQTDMRLLGAATFAAQKLSDTTQYNQSKGLRVSDLFKAEDLTYISSGGMSNVIALFAAINKQLPRGKRLEFITDSVQSVQSFSNPLALDALRMKISAHPGSLSDNRPQWQENVYQAYLTRDYGTKLENTITATSATREMREEPNLVLIDRDGSTVSLAQLLYRAQQAGMQNAEGRAVAAARALTFPGERVSKATANENYRRMLLTLINLQQADFSRHQPTVNLLNTLAADLALGSQSRVLAALSGSNFFSSNVPGNIGPVLVTESGVLDGQQIAMRAKEKALEMFSLTALHYGERDALKLYDKILSGDGAMAASASSLFTKSRLDQLRYHGTEKLKSAGLGSDKTRDISIADLVLVAVAAPATPVISTNMASLSITEASQSIMATYHTTITETSKSIFQLNPRVSLGSRYTTYSATNDPVDYISSGFISQQGLELRLESDLYFAKLDKMLSTGLKPFIYPEFGVVLGSGQRKVGYDGNTHTQFGEIPKFKQNYINWGGHLGLNVGPVLLGMDATVLSTKSEENPYQRFLDLSQGMTYYRYSFLTRVLNISLNKQAISNPYRFTFDVELAGETNNEGTENKTRTQDGSSQIASKEWQRIYDRAHPNGIYNADIAQQMIEAGSVKASYQSANFAAIHLGVAKSGFQFKVTLGLYNRYAIDDYYKGKGEWLSKLAKNTFNGSGFASGTLVYNFGSLGAAAKRRRVERNAVVNGVSTNTVDSDTYSTERVHSGLRSRALIMSKN
ncbi:MAG: hypothetical protein EOO88_03460 [Pedobacter sp.]|nr:MAG: hypothetical protein EOO88_03460 [Pedobacter sp.]